jgi:hypothetical protein
MGGACVNSSPANATSAAALSGAAAPKSRSVCVNAGGGEGGLCSSGKT